MRIPLLSPSAARSHAHSQTPWLLLYTASIASLSHAVTLNPIPDPHLDVSNLGQMGIAGDFNGVSLYQYEGQSEQAFSSNGSGQLMTRLPSGVFIDLLSADASIQTMCVLGGQVALGGNFTSLGGQQLAGIAWFNATSGEVSELAQLQGQVNSLLCDDANSKIYVGGSFQAMDSTNAVTWVESQGWTSLPFAGFNGPVTSITELSNGHIIFGGSFTGLGNTTIPSSSNDTQIINLSSANITTVQGSTTPGFSDPTNIICNAAGASGAGNTWLAEDNVPSTWRAAFGFGFEPSRLRLYNTQQDGRGTKTWRFTAQPNNGIMNFTYIDPQTNQNMSCTSQCPLSHDESVEYQDFFFVNTIGMNAFKIDISDWYGDGAGLNGIQLFENNIFTYAIDDFNEPTCTAANITTPSTATATGPWTVTPSNLSNSEYLSAVLSAPITSDAATVVFRPDIRESGDYIITLYTPGCQQDGTCSRRGQVQVTGILNSTNTTVQQLHDGTSIFQTNDFDKYDHIYIGHVDASSSSFRPEITLSPLPGQSLTSDDLVVVAERIGFELQSSTGGLNGLFEYDPSQDTVDKSDFDQSAYNTLGSSFSDNSAVTSLVTTGDRTYIGGNFTSTNTSNIAAIDNDSQTVLLDGGLNGGVLSMYLSGSQLVVGGSFDNNQDGSASGLSHVAMYDPSSNKWTPLGAGVDGTVTAVTPVVLNLTGQSPEDAISLSGSFTQLLAFDDNDAVNATGFAVWVTSQNNWLQNLDSAIPLWNGFLTTSLLSSDDVGELYAGSIASQALEAFGAAAAGDELGDFPIKLQPANTSSSSGSSGLTKRDSVLDNTDSISGVVAGAFDTNNDRNITILAGRFTAAATNGSTIYNFAVIDQKNSNKVTGITSPISEDSVFLALAVQNDNVFVGGRVNGSIGDSNVTGLVSYSVASNSFNTQPPVLDGQDVAVSSVLVQPDGSDVYVGGSFDTAGSLDCPGICILNPTTNQWTRPGFVSGVVYSMLWTSDTVLLAGGQLTINNTNTSLASYDTKQDEWSIFSAASSLPGPVDALTPASSDSTQVWAAGTQSDGSTYLMKYDGSTWQSAGVTLGQGTLVNSLQVFTVTKSHDSNQMLNSDQVLVLSGSIAIPDFGTASSAIFNGTTLQPYLLSSSLSSASGAGRVSKIFVEKQNFFKSSENGKLAVGFVVLIALAISLGLMLLIVVAGLALDRYRKKREGYVPAPTSMFDRGSGMQRIPPHELLDSLSKGRAGAPHI
ncbi:cortical protein marker for cell polarity-domain-containing protein [Xylariaceae sp. FL0804]|nr:cortical protein marker for cell polarity-domain-containing protein [Xylariaceae sp. FL0804]